MRHMRLTCPLSRYWFTLYLFDEVMMRAGSTMYLRSCILATSSRRSEREELICFEPRARSQGGCYGNADDPGGSDVWLRQSIGRLPRTPRYSHVDPAIVTKTPDLPRPTLYFAEMIVERGSYIYGTALREHVTEA